VGCADAFSAARNRLPARRSRLAARGRGMRSARCCAKRFKIIAFVFFLGQPATDSRAVTCTNHIHGMRQGDERGKKSQGRTRRRTTDRHGKASGAVWAEDPRLSVRRGAAAANTDYTLRSQKKAVTSAEGVGG
jgi:hypothetical protein